MAELTRNIVCKNNQRKYYRFRSSRFYGGISTADSVGCCLRCVFCWSWNVVTRPQECGNYYSPENIAALRKRLKAINPAFEEFEVEELILYPSVEERLNKLKADYITWHSLRAYPLSRYELLTRFYAGNVY